MPERKVIEINRASKQLLYRCLRWPLCTSNHQSVTARSDCTPGSLHAHSVVQHGSSTDPARAKFAAAVALARGRQAHTWNARTDRAETRQVIGKKGKMECNNVGRCNKITKEKVRGAHRGRRRGADVSHARVVACRIHWPIYTLLKVAQIMVWVAWVLSSHEERKGPCSWNAQPDTWVEGRRNCGGPPSP